MKRYITLSQLTKSQLQGHLPRPGVDLRNRESNFQRFQETLSSGNLNTCQLGENATQLVHVPPAEKRSSPPAKKPPAKKRGREGYEMVLVLNTPTYMSRISQTGLPGLLPSANVKLPDPVSENFVESTTSRNPVNTSPRGHGRLTTSHAKRRKTEKHTTQTTGRVNDEKQHHSSQLPGVHHAGVSETTTLPPDNSPAAVVDSEPGDKSGQTPHRTTSFQPINRRDVPMSDAASEPCQSNSGWVSAVPERSPFDVLAGGDGQENPEWLSAAPGPTERMPSNPGSSSNRGSPPNESGAGDVPGSLDDQGHPSDEGGHRVDPPPDSRLPELSPLDINPSDPSIEEETAAASPGQETSQRAGTPPVSSHAAGSYGTELSADSESGAGSGQAAPPRDRQDAVTATGTTQAAGCEIEELPYTRCLSDGRRGLLTFEMLALVMRDPELGAFSSCLTLADFVARGAGGRGWWYWLISLGVEMVVKGVGCHLIARYLP